ncbi:MAG: hypothetical protein NTY12_05125 [Candidatus Falkowbacteria bacterium]|nr:hypothetical protein [Candidatus Falkowbacteria bacterium]
MCFSAPASFVAGAVLSSAGVITLKKVKNKKQIPLALVPLLFGIQQIIEGFVWISFGWGMPKLNIIATYGFTFFSHILWPIFIPIAVFLVETDLRRKKIIMFCGALGLIASFYSFLLMIMFPVSSQINCNSLQYIFSSLGLPFFIHSALYLIATCLVCLISSHRLIKIFGVAAIIFLIISYYFYTVTFASVWCFFAAILSLIIYLFIKQQKFSKKKR